MGSECSTPTHSFENLLHLLCFLLSCLFFSSSREDRALSFPEISFENCNNLNTNVNFIKASFNTNWEFGFFSSSTTFKNRSVRQMNAQVHRHKVPVMARLKPYPLQILSPNSEKCLRIVYKVKGLHFIDLLEFILYFFMSLLLHLWHTQTHKLL